MATSKARFADCVLFLWLAAGALISVISGFDAHRLLLTTALGLVCLAGLAYRRFIVPPSMIGWAGIAIIVLGLLSAAVNVAPGWSLLGVSYLALCALTITSLACNWHETRVDFARLVGLGFVLPAGLYCFVVGATVYSALLSGIPLQYPEPLRHFANIRFFNQYQTWLLPFLPAVLTLACPVPRVRQAFWQAFVVAIAVFFWALFWRSSGRGTGYGTLLATLAVAALLGPAGRAHAMRMAALAASGFAVNLLMFGIGGGARLVSAASPGRWYLWQIAVEKIAEHPWLGIGPMLYAAIDNGVASHPHSAPLQWAVEWGLPAATLILVVICWLLYRWLVTARRLVGIPAATVPPSLVAAVTGSLLAGTLHAMVSGVIIMPASQFMLVTVAGLAAGIACREAPQPARYERRDLRSAGSVAFATVLVASIIYTSGFTAFDYLTRVRNSPTQTATYQRNAYQPRYWADGTLAPTTKAR